VDDGEDGPVVVCAAARPAEKRMATVEKRIVVV
jgi:hypothetical protein